MPAESYTIAICTRNRADHLRRCLGGLAGQERCVRPGSLLVVDNASTDSTADVVSEFASGLRPRLITEPRLGLSHARNAALAAAETEYVVYLDDDAIPLAGWSKAIEDGIAEWNPDLFGGPYVPHYLTPKPGWFDDRFGSAHVETNGGIVGAGYSFSGGNMGWRRSLLVEVGGFDPELGMQGNQLRLGEETAIQMRLWRERPELKRVMLREMLMTHYVPPEKMRLRYIWQRAFTYGRQLGMIDPSNPAWQEASCIGAMFRFRFGLPLVARWARDQVLRRDLWKRYAADWMARSGVYLGAAYEKRAI